jgi:hypothetical protein
LIPVWALIEKTYSVSRKVQGLPIGVFHHKAAIQFLDLPGRWEVELRHGSLDHSAQRVEKVGRGTYAQNRRHRDEGSAEQPFHRAR